MPGPPGPKCRRSLKKVVPDLSARSAKKVPKKSKKSRKSLFLALFRDFFDFFGTFLTLRADRPGTTFLRLFRHFGPGGPGTPCNWSLQSQYKGLEKSIGKLSAISRTGKRGPSWAFQTGGASRSGLVLFFGHFSGSSQRGRCRRGRSEIPHFPSKLQSFALVPGE